MRYTWLFFDADDTLFDFPSAEAQALEASFADAGLAFPPDILPAYHRINQQLWRQLEQGQITSAALRLERFRQLFQAFDLQADLEQFSRRFLVHLAEGSSLLEGAQSLLEHLAGAYQMGLITNGLPEVQRPRLARSSIANFFAFVTISEEIGVAKPDPSFFQAALAQAGNPDPRSVLVIGDNLSSDIRGGFQSGLDTLWYNPGRLPVDPRWQPTYEISALDQIAPLLAML